MLHEKKKKFLWHTLGDCKLSGGKVKPGEREINLGSLRGIMPSCDIPKRKKMVSTRTKCSWGRGQRYRFLGKESFWFVFGEIAAENYPNAKNRIFHSIRHDGMLNRRGEKLSLIRRNKDFKQKRFLILMP